MTRCMHQLRFYLVFVSFCALVPGCNKPSEEANPEPAEEKRPVVLVEKVHRADLTESLIYPVDIEAEQKVSINSLMSERIIKFPWKNGDVIKKGQVVAKVRADNATHALAQMQAELESLDAQIENQKSEKKRAKGLLEKEVITRQTYDSLSAQVKVAEAKRKAVQAAISQTAINAGHAIIRAPMTGIIANKMVSEGDLAAPQIPLCDIMTEDPVKVVLRVPERDVHLITLEQAVSITLDAYPHRTFSGAVTKILPYIDPGTRTNEVEVTLPNPVDTATNQRPLKPGMFGRATIVTKEHKGTLVVSERALLVKDGAMKNEMTAFIVKDDIARIRTVRTGIRQGEQVEVLEGLKENEKVVVRGQYGLKDGQPVRRFNDDKGAKETSEAKK